MIARSDSTSEIGPVTRHCRKMIQRFFDDHVNSIYIIVNPVTIPPLIRLDPNASYVHAAFVTSHIHIAVIHATMAHVTVVHVDLSRQMRNDDQDNQAGIQMIHEVPGAPENGTGRANSPNKLAEPWYSTTST